MVLTKCAKTVKRSGFSLIGNSVLTAGVKTNSEKRKTMVLIDIPMPETCEVCMFGFWSNFYQTGGCSLTDGSQMFDEYSKDYLERRSDKCPLREVKGADDENV